MFIPKRPIKQKAMSSVRVVSLCEAQDIFNATFASRKLVMLECAMPVMTKIASDKLDFVPISSQSWLRKMTVVGARSSCSDHPLVNHRLWRKAEPQI